MKFGHWKRVRCNMRMCWLTTIATFTGSKPAFCYPRLSHDALRLRRGKPRPAGRNKPSAGRGAYAIRALPDLCRGITFQTGSFAPHRQTPAQIGSITTSCCEEADGGEGRP